MSNDSYESSYLDLNVHKMMLQDVVRTEAYERALQKEIRPEHSVIDFGCGTGVLSIFAARSGAKQVHAVDRTKLIRVAQKIAKNNKLTNIHFYHDDHRSLALDEKVDVLVSEWMGHFLFYENMLGPLLKVRDTFLKNGGIMIPKEVTLHASLLVDKEVFEDLSFFRENPYDIDYSLVADTPFEQYISDFFQPNQVMAAVADLGTLNLLTLEAPPERLKGEFVPEKDATVYGICGWFSANLSDGIVLGTGPRDPYTHWNQLLFPLEEPFNVKKDKPVTIEIILPNDEEPLGDKWIWSIDDGTKKATLDNMRFRETEERSLAYGKLPPI